MIKMSLSLKNWLILLLILVHSPFTQGQQLENVTLQLKWKHQFQFAGYYAAIEKGYYKEVGINVTLAEAIEAQNPSDEVFNGNADFGVCASDILLMRSQKKNAVVLSILPKY
jgi:ABC-type nitrate/sulfonate/bicarbonate transport system substrate-binding protein